VCLLFPAGSLAAPNDTVVSSRSNAPGEDSDGLGFAGRGAAVSGDGRYVTFVSDSPNLAPGDPTPVRPDFGISSSTDDVYVRDHLLKRTTTVSLGSLQGVSALAALAPAISANGRHVFYVSRQDNLAPEDGITQDGGNQLYVRDLEANTTALVTRSASGIVGRGNGPTSRGYASADGRYVTFTSEASNLVVGDTNSAADVFVRDRDPDGDRVFDEADATTTLLSPGAAHSISADGRYVTFARIDSSVNERTQVFVRDRKGTAATGDDTTTLVSQSSAGAPANQRATGSSISNDGRLVAFSSNADNLVEGVTQAGIYVRDLEAGTTTLVSRSSAGAPVSADSPSISGDGRFVSFASGDSTVVEPDTNFAADVFVRDLQEGTTAVVSRSSGAGPPDAVFGRNGSNPRSNAYPSSMSADGRFVAFDSTATNLVADDAVPNFSSFNTFRRELATKAPLPSVSVDDVNVDESAAGASGETDATFTLSLSKPSGQAVSVDFQTANDSASAPQDYEARSGTVTFAPGQTQKTVAVKVKGDTLTEPDERFLLNLVNPDRATIADGQGIGTIKDDDTASAALSVNDVSVTEGDVGEVDATFTVSLSPASGQPVTVGYATADGSAPAGATAGVDYTATGGSLLFAAGETQKTVTVKVTGDTLTEPDERFLLNLVNPDRATIADGQGIATIADNDAPSALPRVSIGDVSVNEGNSGTSAANFVLTRSGPTTGAVSVDYQTANGGAIAPGDYLAKTGTATIAAGQASTTVTVDVKGDLLDEPDENFQVNLSNPSGAEISDGQAIGTIIDDDAQPSLSVSDPSVTEGNAGEVLASFDVSLSAPSGRQVTLDYASANDTATEPADYSSRAGSLSFAPGDQSKTVTVAVNGDLLDEENERFLLNLSNAQSATLAAGARGTATIFDNDAEPTLSIDDKTVLEGDSGQVDASFTLSLSAPSGRQVSVELATADQTASAPDDYASKRARVTFAAGETAKAMVVKVNGDSAAEPDERFEVNLSGPANATLTDAQGIATITDDDGPAPGPAPGPDPGPAPAPGPGPGPAPAPGPGPASAPGPVGAGPGGAVTPPGAACVGFRAGIAGGRAGPARLLVDRADQRGSFGSAKPAVRGASDSYCMSGGGSLGIGYPTARMLAGLTRSERRRVSARAVLLLATSKRYSIKGIAPGASVATLRRRLSGERAYRVGGRTWYLAPGRGARLVFGVQGGRVLKVGLADLRLTSTPRAAERLLAASKL